MTKKKKNNDVIVRMGIVYIENQVELSWRIITSAICD